MPFEIGDEVDFKLHGLQRAILAIVAQHKFALRRIEQKVGLKAALRQFPAGKQGADCIMRKYLCDFGIG